MAETLDWAGFAAHVAEFTGADAATLTMSTTVFDELGIDSLGLFSLGLFLIKTYGKRIPITSVASIETIGDIFTMMAKQGAGNKSDGEA